MRNDRQRPTPSLGQRTIGRLRAGKGRNDSADAGPEPAGGTGRIAWATQVDSPTDFIVPCYKFHK